MIMTYKKINQVLDVCIVTYNPDLLVLEKIVQKCIFLNEICNGQTNFLIFDNSELTQINQIETILKKYIPVNFIITLRGNKNIGFGSAINELIRDRGAKNTLVLNQDAIPIGDALKRAIQILNISDKSVAAWEFRQFPFEHPKVYNPVTLEAEWISGAAFIIRKKAFLECGGFEKKFFMYAEDVDLSFKLKANGYKLRYMPDCQVLHYPFTEAGSIKPLQAIEGRLNNLLLRVKYGSWLDVLNGFFYYLVELPVRVYKKESTQLLNTLYRFLSNLYFFRKSGKDLRYNLTVQFQGWNFCFHRIGANFRSVEIFSSHRELPLVSIIIRTQKREELLSQAIQTIRNQTYPSIEIVVVQDGEACSEYIVNYHKSEGANIIYQATGKVLGRSRAGNLGLSLARGEWIGFLDDDDQLFADHIETLISSVIDRKEFVCYGFGIEARADIKNLVKPEYKEYLLQNKYTQNFSRVLLWYKNYLPIQSVIFHRFLYEQLGGFDESLDYYEDWNLWVKYSTITDFVSIEKSTSKYRVPENNFISSSRKRIFRAAYKDAQKKQTWHLYGVSPINFRDMITEYLKYRSIIYITKESIIEILEKIKSKFASLGD